MSKIISIGTAVPAYGHQQKDILKFMLDMYQPEAEDRRRISLLYERSGIEQRFSVIPDFTPSDNLKKFFPEPGSSQPFPLLEQRMNLYEQHATTLSIEAIKRCVENQIHPKELTSLITVSCTGMSAPGLDIGIMEEMELPSTIQRSSVNFMGCYAAIHALRMADHICRSDSQAKVMIVCTELCTLHFQKECDMDSIASGLLFADGAAAVLVTGEDYAVKGLHMNSFYSEVVLQGKKDMAWNLSGRGFLMKLSAYIPQLLKAGISPLLKNALKAGNNRIDSITRWAIHPGGKKILEAIGQELNLKKEDLDPSFDVLREYGNMSSPTVLFVLKNIMEQLSDNEEHIFVAAFGPGLTMETLILEQ